MSPDPTSTEKLSNKEVSRIEAALMWGRERKQEMERNLAWAYQTSRSCNCQSCQYIRAYHEDLQDLLE